MFLIIRGVTSRNRRNSWVWQQNGEIRFYLIIFVHFRLTLQTITPSDITRSSSCFTSRIASSCRWCGLQTWALSPTETAWDIKDSAHSRWCIPTSFCSCQTSSCPASSCSVVCEFVFVSLLVLDGSMISSKWRKRWSKDCGHGCLSVTATLVSTIWILGWGFRNVHYGGYRFANFLGSQFLAFCNKDKSYILQFVKNVNASM